jgi:hypothetical protein
MTQRIATQQPTDLPAMAFQEQRALTIKNMKTARELDTALSRGGMPTTTG